jgi:hypothetical protein
MKGHALHIGINYCNPRDFADCQLDGAIPDAQALRDLTNGLGLNRLGDDGLLLEGAATESGIKAAVRIGAERVSPGELLVITFSGLGVGPDMTNQLEVLQRLRGWVTSDRKVVDVKDILSALSGAPKGATVLVVSACCFVGPRLGSRAAGARTSSARFDRTIRDEARKTFAVRSEADSVRSIRAPGSRASAGSATIYHLAASGINQTIPDGTAASRSPFVGALIELVSGGITPPFDTLLTDLANRLDPDPQLEKFPEDPVFSSAASSEEPEPAKRRTA